MGVVPDNSPTLFGRETQFAELARLLDEARSAGPFVACIRGVAGVGKTAVAEWLARRGEDNGWRLAFATAHRQARHAPFFTWNEVARQIGVAAQSDAPGSDLPEDAQFLRGAQALEAVRTAANESPILIIIDDAQLADDSTLRIIDFLISQIRGAPVLVALVVREEGSDPPFPGLAALLARAAEHTVRLGGLSLEDVRSIVAEASTSSLSEKQVETIHRLSDGRPLLARMLAGSQSSSAAEIEIPRDALDIVWAEIAELPDECLELTRLLAVIGRPATQAEMAEIAGLEPREVVARCESARSFGVLDGANSYGAYWFAHPLMPEAVSKSMDASAKGALHARLAEATSDPNFPRSIYEVASHAAAATAAGMFARDVAVDLNLQAGERSLGEGAWHGASPYFETANRLLDERDSRSLHARATFLEARLIATHRGDEGLSDAWSMLKQAFEFFIEAGDREGAVEAALFPFAIGGFRDVVEMLDRATELVDHGSPAAGQLLARKGVALADEGRDEEALQSLQLALAEAQRRDDPRLKFLAKLHLSQAHYRANRPSECIDAGLEAMALADSAQDPLGHIRASIFVVESEFSLGRLDAIRQRLPSGYALLEKFPHPKHVHGPKFTDSIVARFEGDYHRSLEIMPSGYGLNREVTKCHAGDFGEVDHLLSSRWSDPRVLNTPRFEIWELLFLSAARLLTTPLSDTSPSGFEWLDAARKVAEHQEKSGQPNRNNLFELTLAKGAFVTVAGAPDETASLADEIGSADVLFHEFTGVSTHRLRGRLKFAAGDSAAAAALFTESADICRRCGCLSELAYAERDLADLQRLSGAKPSPHDLTERELEVARYVSEGLTNRQIAAKLHLSHHTIGHHVRSALAKTGSPNRAALSAAIRDYPSHESESVT